MQVNKNNGFLLLEAGDTVKFKLRLSGKFYQLDFDKDGKLIQLETEHQIKCKESIDDLLDVLWTAYKNYPYIFI
jgi:regulation of enolase protein 1 (concanavalin A-like superfamily)